MLFLLALSLDDSTLLLASCDKHAPSGFSSSAVLVRPDVCLLPLALLGVLLPYCALATLFRPRGNICSAYLCSICLVQIVYTACALVLSGSQRWRAWL